jgi:division protein CdvB (Snf7/Vps24/ESCRT-III family)
MSFMFGGGVASSAVDPVRDCRRVISRSIRTLGTECMQLEREEQKCAALIRRAVKSSNAEAAKGCATDLVRTRGRLQTNREMMRKFNAMSARLGTISSTHRMSESMTRMTQVMATLNDQVDVTSMLRTIAEFERQDELTSEKQSWMDDSLSDIAVVHDEDALANDAVSMVLSEFGLDIHSPPTGLGLEGQEDEALMKRLDMLRL